MITKLEHVGIMVTDMERSLKFYQEVLGLALRRREALNDEVELAFLYIPEHPEVEVELVAGRGMDHIEGVVNHLAFTTDNIEREVDRLRDLGVDLVDQAPRTILGNVKIAFFNGPDNEKLELVER